MKRRKLIQNLALGGSGLVALGTTACTPTTKVAETMQKKTTPAIQLVEKEKPTIYKGNVNHSVCRWCYSSIPFEAFIEGVNDIGGLKSIELTTAEEWPLLIKNGLTSAVGTGAFANIEKGFNDPNNHAKLLAPYLKLVEQAAENGIPNVIVFSGNRNGMDDQVGLENCAVGLDAIVKHAEKNGVTVIMELLNSKVNHKDYMCDHTPWGAALVDKMASPNFKLLYDIYHMQIMEGDVIATIQKYKDYIAHYHTGGVPGRNEINETQELYYPAIMKAILDTGYKGYIGQEFIPTWDDKLAALKQGVVTCDV